MGETSSLAPGILHRQVRPQWRIAYRLQRVLPTELVEKPLVMCLGLRIAELGGGRDRAWVDALATVRGGTFGRVRIIAGEDATHHLDSLITLPLRGNAIGGAARAVVFVHTRPPRHLL